MWLLDANVDVHVVDVLGEFGIRAEAAVDGRWGALTNGDLVLASSAAGFTCLLTHDRRFAQSASVALSSIPNFSIVVIRLPQRTWSKYVEQFRAAWRQKPIVPAAGEVVHWPSRSD